MSFITGRAAVVVACSRSEPALFGARIFTTASSFWTGSAPPPRYRPGAGSEARRSTRTYNDVSRSYDDSGTWNFLRNRGDLSLRLGVDTALTISRADVTRRIKGLLYLRARALNAKEAFLALCRYQKRS